MELFHVPDLLSMQAYIKRLEVLSDFSARYYAITLPVAMIEITHGTELFKSECKGEDPRAAHASGELELWKGLIERAYALGGGVSVVRQVQGASLSILGQVNLTQIQQLVIDCQNRCSSGRHTFRELHLAGVCHTSKQVKELIDLGAFSLKGLKSMDLSQNRLADRDLANILSQIATMPCTDLESLKLDDSHVGKASLNVLCDWLAEESCPLKHLSVRNCGLGILSHFERLIMSIASSPSSNLESLETSNLAKNVNISKALSPLLALGTNLRALHMEHCHLDANSDGILVIGRLMRSTTLKGISLRGCHQFCDQHLCNLLEVLMPVEDFCDTFRSNRDTEPYSLNIAACQVDLSVGTLKMSVFSDFSRFLVKDLDISECKFLCSSSSHDTSRLQLFQAIGASITIERLAANNMPLYSNDLILGLLENLVPLARAGSSRLVVLELAHNPIGRLGLNYLLDAFAEAASGHYVLPFKQLDLSRTNCGLSMRQLCGSIRGNASLVQVLRLGKEDILGCLQQDEEQDHEHVDKAALMRTCIPPPGMIPDEYEPLDLPTRYAVLTALSIRDEEGHIRPKFAPEIYRSLFAFSLRPLRRKILVDNMPLYEYDE